MGKLFNSLQVLETDAKEEATWAKKAASYGNVKVYDHAGGYDERREHDAFLSLKVRSFLLLNATVERSRTI